jgi:hypothetical protein
VLTRILNDLTGRVTGPMSFRFFLQPTIAVVLALRAGRQDFKAGRPAYFWAIRTDPQHRRDLLAEGWKDFGKVFLIAIVLDVVYQILVFRWVYPFETLAIAFVLACVPYIVIRGLVNRIARGGPHGARQGLR